jgi:hypothetical protein
LASHERYFEPRRNIRSWITVGGRCTALWTDIWGGSLSWSTLKQQGALERRKEHPISSIVIIFHVIVYIIRINMTTANVLAETIKPVIKVMKIPEFQ